MGLADHPAPHGRRIRDLIARLPRTQSERRFARAVAELEATYWAGQRDPRTAAYAASARQRALWEQQIHEELAAPTTVLIPERAAFDDDGNPWPEVGE